MKKQMKKLKLAKETVKALDLVEVSGGESLRCYTWDYRACQRDSLINSCYPC